MKKNINILICSVILMIMPVITTMSTLQAQIWYTVDGGGVNGINSSTATTATVPSVAVYNGNLYAIWYELLSGVDQIHIKKFNGSGWTDAGSSGSRLNSTNTGVENPKLVSCNGYLYAAWKENDNGINNIHVRKYDGATWFVTQSYTIGDGRNNINRNALSNGKDVDLFSYNNELYAAWLEEDGDGTSHWQLRIAKFDGSLWTIVDNGGTYGLNYNPEYDGWHPRFGMHNNQLYVAWTEVDASGIKQLRVKRYDGGSSWTSVSGGTNGLNYDPAQSAESPFLVSYKNTLYLFWYEFDNVTTFKLKVRVKQYNGTNWSTTLDGGFGLHYDPVRATLSPSGFSYDNLYLSWEENKPPYQIRVISYDGTTKSFLDGNTPIGINANILMRAHNPELIIYKGDLYALWNEDNGGSDFNQQIRAKRYFLPPIVESVTVPAYSTYIAGQALTFTVTFSKDVVLSSGAPSIPITLNTGGTVNANYTGGSGTNTLTFSYTIASGNEDNDGISVGTAIAGGVLVSEDATPLTADLTLYNTGSTTGVKVDAKAPTISISSTAGNPTNSPTIPITITFSESVTGFSVGDISVTNGSAGSFSGSGTTYTASITPSGQGTVTVNIAGSVAQDAAGNNNSAATALTRVYDNVAPTVIISSGATNPTNTSPIPVTITFLESVSDFVAGDITVGNGTKGALSGSGTSYTINITPSGEGAVTIDVAAGVAHDAVGNANTAAAQLSRTYDSQAPSVSLTSTAGNPTNSSPIPVTITFLESVSDFVAGDITVGNGTKGR